MLRMISRATARSRYPRPRAVAYRIYGYGALLGMLLATAACREPTSPAKAPGPAAPPTAGNLAYLTSSSTRPAVGSVITVVAHAAPGGSADAVGSFVATVTADPAGLVFLGIDSTLALVGSRSVNAANGAIKIAGAAPAGFADGQLFALRFRVTNASAVTAMALTISELNSVRFANVLSSLTVDRQVYETRAP